MRLWRSGIGLGCLAMLSVMVLPVRADDFYVDAYYGSDMTGDGSEANPWQHLQFAFDSIEGTETNPHTVHVARGVYIQPENITAGIRPQNYESILGDSITDVYIPLMLIFNTEGSTISNITTGFLNFSSISEISVSNCRFSGNTSNLTAVYIENSHVTLTLCTITNTANVFQIFNSVVTARNCIFTDYNQMTIDSTTIDPIISYSMLKEAYPGDGNIVAEPEFVRPEAFDFRLRAGSPGIDQGDPSDPVPPGGGSRIDMGCHEYLVQPQLFIESVDFQELTGNQNNTPELGETVQPVITFCNYGEPATNLTLSFELDHPDVTMLSPDVSVGDLAFEECRAVPGPVFEITGYSGWGSAAELTGTWSDGTHTGSLSIPLTLHGRDFYIDAVSGNDTTGDGSAAAPFQTIGHSRDRARGSRLHPVTLRPRAGTYSSATTGETFPLWLDEYEDLRGVGQETVLYNDSMDSGYFLRPSRTANLSDFSFYSIAGGIWTQSTMNVIFHSLYSHYENENSTGVKMLGSSIIELSSCDMTAFSSTGYEPGDDAFIHDCILETALSGGSALFESNTIGPNSFRLSQMETDNQEFYPGNTAIYNIITAPTEIHNVNVFTNNICQSVTVETEVPFEISGNFTYATMGSMESAASVTFTKNIGIRLTNMPSSFSVSWGAGPSFRNCISLPLCFGYPGYDNFNAHYGGYDLDGCVALFSDTGVDYPACWRTRNSVLYYLSEGNAACTNTQYSDLMDCPEPTNIDEDPGFVGIARITDIGPDWFSDDTAAWEPGRYTGYYVNPNIVNNINLFYCVGNSSDTIYVMGDPRTAAAIGDLFVIPDLHLRRIADGFAFDSPLIDAGDPSETDPDGTRRDIGPYGGPYALTPMPVIPTWPPPDETPTPVPTHTPTPTLTPTPVPTDTPTHTPAVTGVSLSMPAHWFRPDDPCYCSVTVTNAGTDSMTGYPLFVILDVYGEIFFAPSFSTSPDMYPGPWNPGDTLIDVIPLFSWPETGTTASGIVWYAALVDPTGSFIVGEWDSFEFGWE